MNNNNYIFYAIIIYILIITILIITKPDYIYDHDNSKFKQFGYTKDKTMFPIGVLAIFIAVVIIVLFSFLKPEDNNKSINNQYMVGGGGGQIPNMMAPVYHQHIMPYQVPVVKTTLSSEQMMPNIIYQTPQTGGQPIQQIIQPPSIQQQPVQVQQVTPQPIMQQVQPQAIPQQAIPQQPIPQPAIPQQPIPQQIIPQQVMPQPVQVVNTVPTSTQIPATPLVQPTQPPVIQTNVSTGTS
jgi:hypothetical protein